MKETLSLNAPETRNLAKGSEDLRAHFGLHEMPFTREIAVSDRWIAPYLDEARADLLHTIEQRQSGVLIAPAGAGKTGLLRSLVSAGVENCGNLDHGWVGVMPQAVVPRFGARSGEGLAGGEGLVAEWPQIEGACGGDGRV